MWTRERALNFAENLALKTPINTTMSLGFSHPLFPFPIYYLSIKYFCLCVCVFINVCQDRKHSQQDGIKRYCVHSFFFSHKQQETLTGFVVFFLFFNTLYFIFFFFVECYFLKFITSLSKKHILWFKKMSAWKVYHCLK